MKEKNQKGRAPRRTSTTAMSKQMKKRVYMSVGGGLGLFSIYVVGTLFNVSVISATQYQEQAAQQQASSIAIPANRGSIYDANMEVLASSATVWTVVIDPNQIQKMEDKERAARLLSSILGLEYEKVFAQTQKDNQYEIIAKKVEKPQADEIRKLILEQDYYFIYLEEDSKRYYPQETMAAQVIGFTNADNNGTYGVEEEYNDILEGVNGRIITAVDGTGTPIPTSYEERYDPVNGSSIQLTIDSNIQRFAEQALENAVAAHNPRNGATAIVMDIETGAILGMANSIGFDLNNPGVLYSDLYNWKLDNPEKWEYDYDTRYGEYVPLEIDPDDYEDELVFMQWQNTATMTQYNPGSVFKLVTGAAAFEEGIVNLGTTHTCTGSIEVADAIYNCHNIYGHGTLDFIGMIQKSCNPAFIWMGQMLGIDTFNIYLDNFGITEKTGIDLPAEASSSYYSAEEMSIVDLASESFGQSLAVTPIQMLTATCAIANEGQLMEPYIVGHVLDASGNVVSTTQPNVKRQIISEGTANAILQGMEAMAQSSAAAVNGYRVGAKSGTSQINNESGSGRYVSSMVAVAPIEDPKIGVIVVVNEPQNGEYYGSKVAAPVVHEILADTLPYMGILPEYTQAELDQLEALTPVVTGKTLDDARQAVVETGFTYSTIGNGDTVVAQIPQAGTAMVDGGTVLLYTEETTDREMMTVPDVMGLSVSQAEARLEAAGLNASRGSSVLTSTAAVVDTQSVLPGTEIEKGTVVTISFSVTIADG